MALPLDNSRIAESQECVAPGDRLAESFHRPVMAEAIVRAVNVASQAFAYGSTALATAFERRDRVTLVVNECRRDATFAELSCWTCARDQDGIELESLQLNRIVPQPGLPSTEHLTMQGGPGDVLIACDPWGEQESICRALRTASLLRMTTISITADSPNLLAALAVHAVRVPIPAPFQPDPAVMVLRHLVQTAGSDAAAAHRRTTSPLGLERMRTGELARSAAGLR